MKRYRAFIIPAVGIIGIAIGFLVFSLNDSLVYFKTPTELLGEGDAGSSRTRLGGQVVEGSVATEGGTITFEVTDGVESVPVVHTGAPQQLFQEGIGIVVEGSWNDGTFRSDTMIIRHDEQYRTRDGTYELPTGGQAAP
jgi:cytochrome c-type biogenesis protein CcmE